AVNGVIENNLNIQIPAINGWAIELYKKDDYMIKNEGDKLKKVIVSSPKIEYCQISDLRKHNIAEKANISDAFSQHNELKQLLTQSGARVIDIQELPEHPNSVFTRDTAVVTPQGFIKLRMGLPAREGEEQWMAEKLDSLKITQVYSIKYPGTVEGGDIILAGKVVFVGYSSRTNMDGINQLKQIFQQMDYEVQIAKIPSPYLHIGGAMSMIAPDTVLCCSGVFPENFFSGYKKIEVLPGNFISGNVITLGENEVIAHSDNRTVIKILKENNVKVHALNLTEFVKGTGGPSCLIMPVERG
ncbi:MAG: hypothetical protein KAR38_15180, partial [Calditrichia bacterium]|nr:hypothetical protein [Calditrichia bacterium]